MKIEKLNDNGATFDVAVDGTVRFRAEREYQPLGRRGHWVLHDLNNQRLGRFQFSSDLLDEALRRSQHEYSTG